MNDDMDRQTSMKDLRPPETPQPDPEVTTRILHDLYGEERAKAAQAEARQRGLVLAVASFGLITATLVLPRLRRRANMSWNPEGTAAEHLAEHEALLDHLSDQVSLQERGARGHGFPWAVLLVAAGYALWRNPEARQLLNMPQQSRPARQPDDSATTGPVPGAVLP